VTFDARLVAYLPGTETRLRHLPEPLSWEASFPHNDVSALRLTYSGLALGGDVLSRTLEQGVDMAVQIDCGSGWEEPDGGRFLLVRRDVNPADPSETHTLTAPGYGWLLGKANAGRLEMLETGGDFAGQRLVEAANPGKIMATFAAEYLMRHSAPAAWGWDFDASVDSASVAWPVFDPPRAVPYPPEKTLAEILAGLVSMEWCDWRMRGRMLKLWVRDSQFENRAADVKLRLGVDIGDAPSTETIEDAAGYTLAFGEGSVVTSIRDAAAPSVWGVWEAVSKVGGATTVADVQSAVAGEVAYRARAAGQYTRTLLLHGAQVLPWRDYVPGDVVAAPASTTELVAMRVQQVTLSRDGQGNLGGSVVLNDRMVPGDLRVARRLSMLTGGSPAATGRIPTVPPRLIPKAPTDLALTTNAWWNYGVSRATVGATWTPVTQSTEGKPIVVSSYRVRVTPVGIEASAATASATIADLPTGTTVQIQIAAVSDQGVQGAWSSVAGISTAIPPNTLLPPTALALTTGDGLARATWDGKLQAPPAAPVDPPGHMDRIIVLSAPAAAGPWSPAGSIHTVGGSWLIPGDVGQTVYVRGVAVDRAGNQTGPGPITSITITSWVTTAVGNAQTAANNAIAAAAAAQTTADGKNRTKTGLTQPATPPGGWVQGDLWYPLNTTSDVVGVRIWNGTSFNPYRFTADSVLVPGSAGTISLANGAVTAPKLFVDQAMVNALAVDSLWAGKIKAPWMQVDQAMIDALTVSTSLWASKVTTPMLAAGAATVDKLSVGALSLNAVANGEFEDGMASWTPSNSAGNSTYLSDKGSGGMGAGRYYMVLNRASGAPQAAVMNAKWVPVTAGERLAWSMAAHFSTATARLYYRLRWRNSDGTDQGYTDLVNLLNGSAGWAERSGIVQVPANNNIKYAEVQLINYSTTAPADYIAVDYARLTKAIVGDMLVDGAIDGKTITGVTITGGTLQTAASGQRMRIQSGIIEGRNFDVADYRTMELNPYELIFYDNTPAQFSTAVFGRSGIQIGDGTGNFSEVRDWRLTTSNEFGYGRVLYDRFESSTTDYAVVLSASTIGLRMSDGALGTTTTGNAATWVAGGIGYILRRNTSIAASKRLIKDVAVNDFLSLRPRTWFDRAQMLEAGLDPDTATEDDCLTAGLLRVPGFIAEEVEAINPLWCIYDQGEDGHVLSGVAYDRLAAAIHPALAALAARVDALESTR
jgi:hypothetical protein